MFNRLKIGVKITLVLSFSLVILLLGFSVFVYNSTFFSLKKKYTDELIATNLIEKKTANIFFNEKKSQLRLITDQFKKFRVEELSKQDSLLTYLVSNNTGIKNLWIFNQTMDFFLGQRSFEADPSTSLTFHSFNPFLEREGLEIIFGHVYEDNEFFYVDSEVLFRSKDSQYLVLKAQIDVTKLLKTFVKKNLEAEKETIITHYLDDEIIQTIRRSDDDKKLELLTTYVGEADGRDIQIVLEKDHGIGTDLSDRGIEIHKAWQKIPEIDWVLVSSYPNHLIYEDVKEILKEISILGLFLLLFAFVGVYSFVRTIIAPIQRLQKSLQLVSQGILPEKIDKSGNDEIAEMVDTVNDLVSSLKKMVDFTKKIGSGDYKSTFKPLSKNDILRISLLNMRGSIQLSDERDRERNWIVSGVAEIGSILRKYEKLDYIAEDVLSYLTERIGANQGAFYVVNDSELQESTIEMIASNAFNKKKYLKSEFKFSEGLVGQSAIEKETILRTEIPEDYVHITSGLLGDVKPSCILVVPLISEDKVYGVLEFAGFTRFDNRAIKLCEEISAIIARTISNVKINEKTVKLLEESQMMSNELQESQIELNRNAEEMRVTQVELEFANNQLEEQIEEVNITQKRMQLLLENASEIITIFEKDGTVRYVSPSVNKIVGYNESEIVGTSFLQNVESAGVEEMERMFEELIEYPDHSLTIQYPYKLKNGTIMWLEATGNNFLDDAAVKGVIVNSRDITEELRAEREERMRSKMQSLSENSPDLISRFDDRGEIFYINPTIETYTGNSPEHFLEQKIEDVELPNQVKEDWSNLFERVKFSNQKENIEMNFSSKFGERIMDVSAIPEFDGTDSIESVLFVAHDITNQKLIETEIKNKNRKITESINYASRIQDAILPDYTLISKNFPESFVFYEAKDVVSGDFPWYLEVGDFVYIAAVDCTGHGVPGALMSLIGNFLLNNIVKNNLGASTGEILDLLDEQVIHTLKQNQNTSTTKDGMDVALCKYHKQNHTLEFSGAHRPLYLIQDSELKEIKGNRFSIGGGKAKNQTLFTTHTISLKPKDTIYISSDGYADQFGGEKNRKIGSRKFRELLQTNLGKEMASQKTFFETFWRKWKGEYKQTDDVLLMAFCFDYENENNNNKGVAEETLHHI